MKLLERLLLFVLHYFKPEAAHHFVIFLFKIWQKPLFSFFPPRAPLLPQKPVLIFTGISFGNRIGLAAGFDKNAEVFPSLSRLGFGFIEVGTVTPLPQPGNLLPRLLRVPPQSLVNRMGFNNCGMVQFKKNLERLRGSSGKTPILVNIGKGKNTPNDSAINDYRELASVLAPCSDAFVINVSSPNTPGLRDLQNEGFLVKLEKDISWQKPVWIKLAPDLENEELIRLLAVIRDSSIYAGVVLTNTSRALAQSWREKGFDGGFSGPPLLNRSLECVCIARRELPRSKTIIGVGGISSLSDAKEMVQAGADLVEVYTAFVYKGPVLIREIAKFL